MQVSEAQKNVMFSHLPTLCPCMSETGSESGPATASRCYCTYKVLITSVSSFEVIYFSNFLIQRLSCTKCLKFCQIVNYLSKILNIFFILKHKQYVKFYSIVVLLLLFSQFFILNIIFKLFLLLYN